MRRVKLKVVAMVALLVIGKLAGQGLLVDQASGTLTEPITQSSLIPDNQIAQSFTPSCSAVGFVQFSEYVPAFPGNNAVTFVVNLRSGAYNGPIVSSTDPVVLVNKFTQIGTFYFPDNITVTPGQLYFFEPVLQSLGQLAVGYKSPSSYPGGDAWGNGAPTAGADYWFREGVVVPEPSVIALFGLGATALFGCRLVGRRS